MTTPAYLDKTLSDLADIKVVVDKDTNLATVTVDVQTLQNILVLASIESYNVGKTKPVDPEKDEYGHGAASNREAQIYQWNCKDTIDVMMGRLGEANELARDGEVRYNHAATKEHSIKTNRGMRALDIQEAGELWEKQGLRRPHYEVEAATRSTPDNWLAKIGATALNPTDLEAVIKRAKQAPTVEADVVNLIATVLVKTTEADKSKDRIKAALSALQGK